MDPASTTAPTEPRSTTSKWRTLLAQTPWMSILLLLLVLACTVASAAIIIVSNNQTVASWKIQPTVLLAVLSAVLDHSLGMALYISVAITWWRIAARGTTLERLDYIWSHGTGARFFPSLLTGFDANKVAVIYLLVIMAKFVNNPLFQRSTQIVAQNIVTNDTLMLDLTQKLPDGWAATVGSYSLIGTRDGLLTYQAWYWNDTILTRNTTGYYCDGMCNGNVPGAGITYDCASTAVPLNLTVSGGVVFAINFTNLTDSTGAPYLFLTTLYSSAIDDSCIATLTVDTCNISAAIVEYPVTITNTTVLLTTNGLQSLDVVSTFIDDGDLPTAPLDSGAGPLQGLNDFFGTYLWANATVQRVTDYSLYSGGSEVADVFYEPQTESYDDFTFAHCGLKFSSPTAYVLDALNSFMFLSALGAANSSTDVQSFAVQRTNQALVFRSDVRYLAAALVFILVALLAVMFLLWGFWEISRPVSFSPIETANVFQAPTMHTLSKDLALDGILKKVGKTKVKYESKIGMRVDGPDAGLLEEAQGEMSREHESKAVTMDQREMGETMSTEEGEGGDGTGEQMDGLVHKQGAEMEVGGGDIMEQEIEVAEEERDEERGQ